MRRKRRIPPRRHRPEPPETGQDLSGTAANAQSLIGKALGSHLERLFLRSQTLVFPQNRLTPDIPFQKPNVQNVRFSPYALLTRRDAGKNTDAIPTFCRRDADR